LINREAYHLQESGQDCKCFLAVEPEPSDNNFAREKAAAAFQLIPIKLFVPALKSGLDSCFKVA